MSKHSEHDSESEYEESSWEEEEEERSQIKKKPSTSKIREKDSPSKKTPTKSSKDVKDGKSRKRKGDLFDDLKVDIDMSCDKLDSKRVRISQNLILEAKMVEVKDEKTKKNYSYPAIVFLRKVKDGKIFEFNVPIILASKLCDAINTVIHKQ